MMQTLSMSPAPGERLLRFVGDTIRFTLRTVEGQPLPPGFQARLRTNLGRAALVQREVVQSYSAKIPIAGGSWRDVPLREEQGQWTIELTLTEVGFFKAKAYALDPAGHQYWPEG